MIMLYALNLYSDVCQLFLKKTEGKKNDQILWFLEGLNAVITCGGRCISFCLFPKYEEIR